MTQQDDPLNNILLDARKQLQELQRSLHDPNVGYGHVLTKLSETTQRLQNETENIHGEKLSESSLIPLTGPRKKKVSVPTAKPDVSPREYRPYAVNKATVLRGHFTPKYPKQKNVPVLKPNDKTKPVTTLLAEGKLTRYDDVSEMIGPIQGNVASSSIPLFGTIQVDIKGAAMALRKRKERHFEEAERFREKVRPYLPTAGTSLAGDLGYFEEEEEAVHEEPKQPRIYEELQDEFAYQTLLVVRGKIARETPDFESFKRTNRKLWNKISVILEQIEKFCVKYEIQFSEINGRKLGEAALLKIVTEDDIYACLVGIEELVLKKKTDAANTIKRAWKRYKEMLEIENRKMLFKAAFTIQNFWRSQLAKKDLIHQIREKLRNVSKDATELSETLRNQYGEIEQSPHVVVHVVVSPQDLIRCFDLMYRNVEMILLLPSVPAAHIWEEFLELLAQNGITDANARIHFILLKEGEGVSKRLMCDMKSVQQARRFICGRPAMLIPHYDWSPESRLSTDIGLPIFGCVDTTDFQSRAAVRSIFQQAGVVFPLGTKESMDLDALMSDALSLMQDNQDLKRWIIRLGYTPGESGIGWFELTNEYLNDDADLTPVIKKSLHCVGGSVPAFLSHIPDVGATIEAVPQIIHSFPTVSLLLTGNEIRVFGTYDRLHYAPFRFGANLVPAVSVDGSELVQKARQVGAALMKRGVMGYVLVDFMAFKEDGVTHIMGFDIRLNSYPSVLSTVYMNTLTGYVESSNKVVLLDSIQNDNRKVTRYVLVQNGLTHPGMHLIGMKDLKKTVYSQGHMFDLLNRVGFRMVFLEAPAEGKGFAISSGQSVELAMGKMEKAFAHLLRVLGQKVGSDASSSISQSLISIRHFRSRVL